MKGNPAALFPGLRSVRGIGIALSLACQLVALGEAYLIRGTPGIPEDWYEQLPILWTLGFLLTLSLFRAKKDPSVAGILFFRCIVFVVTTAGLAGNVEIRLLLLAPFLLETGTLLPFPAGPLASLAALVLAILIQRPLHAWGNTQPAVAGYQKVFVGAISSLVVVLVTMILVLERRRRSCLDEVRTMSASISRLTDANLGFQDYAAGIGRETAISERMRISREIHDTAGYTLTNIVMLQEAALRMLRDRPERLMETILDTRRQAVDGLEEIRHSLRSLRQLGDEKLRGPASIQNLVRSFSNATGIEVSVEYGDIPAHPDERTESAVYRFVQEGMTNAFRHGKATHIRIQFYILDSALNISIIDDGIGAPEIVDGIGLQGMRERIASLGGSVEARGLASGFRLFAAIPLEREAAREVRDAAG